MYNKVIMVGNLTKDISFSYTQGGIAIAKSSIAVNEKYKTQNGEDKERVCFIDITFFGRTAEIANQFLKKGNRVLVEGKLIFDQWVDNNNMKRSKHSIAVNSLTMLGSSTNTDNPIVSQEQTQEQRKEKLNENNKSYPQQESNRAIRNSSNSQPQPQHQANSNSGKLFDIPTIDIEDEEIPF